TTNIHLRSGRFVVRAPRPRTSVLDTQISRYAAEKLVGLRKSGTAAPRRIGAGFLASSSLVDTSGTRSTLTAMDDVGLVELLRELHAFRDEISARLDALPSAVAAALSARDSTSSDAERVTLLQAINARTL